MEEENNKRTGITAKIAETGIKPPQRLSPTEQLKEATIIGGLVVGSLSGLTVGNAVYDYAKNNGHSDPNKATETVLPESPPHTTKTPQQLIKEFEDKNLGGKGHAEKIENGKEVPAKSR